jgi:aspartyl-tRNA(Asn)/glutamyl-tRNA(Gln) amidotransferase subunit B
LFCGCRNAFGDEPNTNICPVCLGLPGSLPVLNERAVEYAMRIGTALHCTVVPSVFHRKNYFYPDMPKDYQISQYDRPINVDGWLELPGGQRVGIVRAHIEEDTGKSTHVGGGGRIHEAGYSLVDYNRAGVPLVETVSHPDLRGADQARAYVEELRAILVATGASDGKMEEGSLRVDANVSMRTAGSQEFGTRCEIKNMNSLRSLGRAIEYEAVRQIALLEAGHPVVQETRHWNEADGQTHSMRSRSPTWCRSSRPPSGWRRWRPPCLRCRPSAAVGWPRPAGSIPRPTRWSRWSTSTWIPSSPRWPLLRATPSWRCGGWPTRWPPRWTRPAISTPMPSAG